MRKFFSNDKRLDWDNHDWCSWFFAECSALAYHDGTKAKKELKNMGFNNYKFLDNDGAQCHIFHDTANLVIAFRGTEPTQLSDVKADLLAIKRKSKTEGHVHMGFKVELRKLWNDIQGLIDKKRNHNLWITGHSLGGAMATLCASRLEEREPKLFTYGSPRVGGKEFCANCEIEHYRFTNNNDIVPSIPFWIMGFRHHGDQKYLNYHGNIRKLTPWQKVKDSMRGRWKALKKFQLFDGMYDHSVTGYADKLKEIWENK